MEFAVRQGAEAYRLEGTNGKAVLLIHGYTGTPAELRPLGDYLHQLGYTVLGVRLPGHGTFVEDLEQRTAQEWYAEAAKGARKLLEEFPGQVYVAGLSMGGLLAMRIAASMSMRAAAIMSAPIFLPDKRIPFYPLLKHFVHYLPKHKKDYGEMMRYNLSYAEMPTKPLGSLFAFLKKCKKYYLRDIKCPTLVLQSTIEHTVEPRSAQFIYDQVGCRPTDKKLVWLHKSGHILSLDKEREQIFSEIAAFFACY